LVDQGFHAAVADVEVDTDTGTVTVLNLFTTHDVGQALNPSVLDSGFRGAISGFALEFALHPLDAVDPSSLRRLTFPTGSYGTDSLTIGDFPNHQTTFLTTPNPYGPYGALGCEEGPHKLITPAIIDAIYNAIGVRFYQAPITYDVILKALGKV
jgi:xanthine dehydrogenase molybdenum-binding subunit